MLFCFVLFYLGAPLTFSFPEKGATNASFWCGDLMWLSSQLPYLQFTHICTD